MGTGKFESVFNEIHSGSLARARKLLKPLVRLKKTDPDALFLLGLVRVEGRSTVVANEEAFKWFKEAASRGHLYGKYYAALAYLIGFGVRKNRRAGIRWLEDCAERGCASAMYRLATLYLESNGVDYDIEKVIEYLTKAASHPGIPFNGRSVEFAFCTDLDEFVEGSEAEAIAYAQEYLFYLYSGEAEDVPRDADMAAKWAAMAVVNSFDELTWPLIDIYVEIGNQGEAKKLLLRLVQKNDPRAMYELARLYEKSGSKEEQDQVYRLNMEARKGGYPRNTPPTPFPMPKKRPYKILDLFDEDEWPTWLAKADQYRIDDPYELKIKVRTYHKLVRSECPAAALKLTELRAFIGDSRYHEIMDY